jgi:hypothetical protein
VGEGADLRNAAERKARNTSLVRDSICRKY